ncbi:hypothetical protein BDV26DRAFT_278537 [Aspergillus bertholletiae]|uniref:Oxidoreductase n=1 Tax=Aspergillus bertholletiae TaxID=1226010 RepID=A0A5N7BJ13_9EURO|nr:hypothetical protein BDV26DRAFT_278537 [Aspergillus bertholletiae]
MASSVAGKVFIVSGSASGMGLATASVLLARDSLSRFVQGLDADQQSRVLAHTVGITNRSAITSFLRSTKEKYGRLDGIAYLAGTAGHKLDHQEIWEISDGEYDFIMDVNVRGVFNLLSEGLNAGLLQEPESIVHIASIFSERGFVKGSIYSASKYAEVGMAKSAAIETGKRGIRVNVVTPGSIDTAMLRANEESGAEGTAPATPLGRLGEAPEVANVVTFLLGEEARFVNGATWAVDGGANA